MILKNPLQKKAKHIPSGYSWITCFSFNESKNEQDYYRGKDCIEMFYKDLRDQEMKIINYEKKEMISLIDEETESYEKQKVCYYVKNNLVLIRIIKSEIIVITQENLEEPLILFVIEDTKYRKKFLWYFIMVLHMIIIS